MPIYSYFCVACNAEQDVLMSPPAPEQMTLDCAVTKESTLHKRKWTAPSIGMVEGAGFSPARN